MKHIEKGSYIIKSEAETRALGLIIAEAAEPGDIVALIGDLGTGKTALTKYIAEGLGVKEDVISPTFTIVKEYRSGRIPLYHFDVYRLSNGEELLDTGAEDYLEDSGLSVIEWADIVADVLPADALVVMIEYAEEGARNITIL
ncbi:MAG: tRNA (adenosine(37)-N6)-threonylcarbamoyltransferase complex ATPase subunit type 1 TsaE [Mogibacterium sp.]|nr:tRNA (adenosine(37)-N6)-threonylcarbamoyltransferase complex ATPase subunit type 1 TsaE [Mogibacterium sp.]